MLVYDIDKRQDLELIDLPKDIETIITSLPFYHNYTDDTECPWFVSEQIENYWVGEKDAFGCLFVQILDGYYGDVYLCEGSIPYLNLEVFKIN